MQLSYFLKFKTLKFVFNVGSIITHGKLLMQNRDGHNFVYTNIYMPVEV